MRQRQLTKCELGHLGPACATFVWDEYHKHWPVWYDQARRQGYNVAASCREAQTCVKRLYERQGVALADQTADLRVDIVLCGQVMLALACKSCYLHIQPPSASGPQWLPGSIVMPPEANKVRHFAIEVFEEYG